MKLTPQSPLHNLLTSGVKLAQPELLRRIVFLNQFQLIFVIVAPFLGLFYFYVGATPLTYVTIIAGLLGIAVILLLRMTKNPQLMGNIALFILWGLLVLLRWNTGGVSAGGLSLLSWVWNPFVILLAIFMTGYLWGTLWTCLVFVESGLAILLYRTGHVFTNLLPPEIMPIYSLGSYLVGMLVMLLIAFLFEKEKEDARLDNEEKSRMLGDAGRYVENIVERLPLPTFVVDRDHRVVQWNRACQEMTGIPAQETIGKRVWEGFSVSEHGSLADSLLENPQELSETYRDSIVSMTDSGSLAVETTLPNVKGGLKAIIHTAPILDHDGKLRGAIQSIQEVSRGSEGFVNPAAMAEDGMKDFPIYRVDAKGKISSWNKACEQGFGYPLSQMIGNSPLILVSKPYRRDFKDSIVRVFKGESFDGKEWKCYTSEGQPMYVLAKMVPLRALSGKVQECLVINTDITDLRLKMKRLLEIATESREELRSLSDEYKLLKKNIATFIRRKNT